MLKLLFVCHGNICRSPMAECIMAQLLRQRGMEEQVLVDSAAVSTEELGHSIYPPAREELRRQGVPLRDHRAWQVSAADYSRYDLFIAMDRDNVSRLIYLLRGDPDHKIRMLMDYVGTRRDVTDPWYTDRFDTAFTDIYAGCSALLDAYLRGDVL